MGKYIVKRVLLLIPTIFIICAIVFGLMRMVPGDAVDIIVNRMTQSGQTVDEAAIRARLGLDVPAVQQFFNWMGNVFRGDLGDSFFQYDSVWNIIKRQLPISLELGLITLILANLISIPLGLFCAARQDSIPDYAIRIIAVVLMAIPMFWLATLVLFYPAQWWGYAPPVVYVSFFQDPIANLQMFLVPAIMGALAQAGMQLRTVRTVVLDTMRQDYIRTAYAKGVKQRVILFKHAFRNAMIPVITIIGGSIAALVGGNVILENIFNIPGIGQQLVTALGQRDFPMVQGCVLIMSIFVMIVNLVIDVAYKWIDPRVTLD
ncbi:MAG: ABC transporter permease [Oscillospiraceae bacterium]|nr:ABC transporter permease [Oscillospiraceae bacterium]